MGGRIWGRKATNTLPDSSGHEALWHRLQAACGQRPAERSPLAGLFAQGKQGSQSQPSPGPERCSKISVQLSAEREKSSRSKKAVFRAGSCGARRFSSAAFLLACALIVPGSQLLLKDVGINPTRAAAVGSGENGGANEIQNRRSFGSEPVADLFVEAAGLTGTEVAGELVPLLIDEIPVLAALAAAAEGTTTIRDAAELRVKESDRIKALATGLRKMGACVEELPDGLIITGGRRLIGAQVDSCGDHRIAMALAVAAQRAEGPTQIAGAECVDISFPNFWQFFRK